MVILLITKKVREKAWKERLRIMVLLCAVLDDSKIPEDVEEADQDLNLDTEVGLESCSSVNC